MGAWEILLGLLEPAAVGLLLIALGWAAAERGRVHHHLAPGRRVSRADASGRAGRFSALDRVLRRRI